MSVRPTFYEKIREEVLDKFDSLIKHQIKRRIS